MLASDASTKMRKVTRDHEQNLPVAQRKALGQFFSGMPLGKLLAHLAIEGTCKTVLDPMAGTGDLLEAVFEASAQRGIKLKRLDAIEIDPDTARLCKWRLNQLCVDTSVASSVVAGDAFDVGSYNALCRDGYDLVITNPPYVRYQSLGGRGQGVRDGLKGIVEHRVSRSAREIWSPLVDGYSGLADLSVPSWLLAALMVRAGGTLALVVPTTWRTRAYADVIHYLLLRCFEVEVVVQDTQSGWFSDALVRTELIVARRLEVSEASDALIHRSSWGSSKWISIKPAAANATSLVGTLCPSPEPEKSFAALVRSGKRTGFKNLDLEKKSLAAEWAYLLHAASQRLWFQKLELISKVDHHADDQTSKKTSVPTPLNAAIPDQLKLAPLASLEEIGIRVGQGLRTGCNRFFYVQALKASGRNNVEVETGAAYLHRRIIVPSRALRPVLHRQVDVALHVEGGLPDSRVLDLRQFALPEDLQKARHFSNAYRRCNEALPIEMPADLADHVRRAGIEPLGDERGGQPVSALSAVRTNVRLGTDSVPPRFWYMLPAFADRHRPQAFIPRIIHRAPTAYSNFDPPLLIDANFSTLWAQNGGWTSLSLAAFLNSTWCRANMEALGTPMGGGALKLEAVHLKALPVPKLDVEQIRGISLCTDPIQVDRIVLQSVLEKGASPQKQAQLREILLDQLAAQHHARTGASR